MNKRTLIATSIAAVLTLATAACSPSPDDATPQPPSTPSSLESTPPTAAAHSERLVLAAPPPGHLYEGWYTHDVAGEWDDYTTLLGGVPPVIFTFHDWNAAGTSSGTVALQTFNAPIEGSENETVLEVARRAADAGSILAVAWDAVGYVAEEESYWSETLDLAISFEDILTGQYDDYIRTCAAEIRDLAVPIMLSPFGEIDSTAWFMFGPDELTPLETVDDTRAHYGDPDLPDGPERLRDAYRHIVDIFTEEQVHNVTWFIYGSTGYMATTDKTPEELERIDEVHPRFFHPGDDYVDWIGTSIYIDSGEETLEQRLRPGIEAWREVSQHPYFAPEFGIVAADARDRAPAIAAIVEALPASGVQLVAFADGDLYEQYFDIPRLHDRPDEADVWRTVRSDPRYERELKFVDR